MADERMVQEFHHGFSVSAHNRATDILYGNEPTEEEVQGLIELAHVAHWHWVRRTDKTPQNISVALWLLSRAYSANGFGQKALDYAKESLSTIEHEDLLPSFYGYSNEALARAYLVLNEKDQAMIHLKRAKEIADTVPNLKAREYLLDQINRIKL